jgi:hypothetical protein
MAQRYRCGDRALDVLEPSRRGKNSRGHSVHAVLISTKLPIIKVSRGICHPHPALFHGRQHFIVYKEDIREDGRLTRFSVVARVHTARSRAHLCAVNPIMPSQKRSRRLCFVGPVSSLAEILSNGYSVSTTGGLTSTAPPDFADVGAKWSNACGELQMRFDEVLAQVLELLQRERRLSYRALKRRFSIDDEYLEDLKAEIIDAKRLAADENGTVLVWTGAASEAGIAEDKPAEPASIDACII